MHKIIFVIVGLLAVAFVAGIFYLNRKDPALNTSMVSNSSERPIIPRSEPQNAQTTAATQTLVDTYRVNSEFTSGIMVSRVDLSQVWIFGVMEDIQIDPNGRGGVVLRLDQGTVNVRFEKSTPFTSAKKTIQLELADHRVISSNELKTGDHLEITAKLVNNGLSALEIRRKIF